MGASDGTVVGMTQIVDQGPRSRLLNIAVVSEGYTSGQLGLFAAQAQQFVNRLFTVTPLSTFKRIFNVFRFDVASTQSGADDPATCGDNSTGSGTRVATFFDASFCDWGLRRLISLDDGLVKNVVNRQLSQWHLIVVLVNSGIYGGAGGQVARFSTVSGWAETAIHEMGHTLFGLADEYDSWAGCGQDTDRDNYASLLFHWEPGEPNITGVTKRSDIKWRDLILPSTSVPTMKNPDCTTCDPRSSPVPTGTVGIFEGAGYYHCGLFRPEFACRMGRNQSKPFCAVCSRRIEQKLAPFWSWVITQPLTASADPILLPPGKPTQVTVHVKDRYTGVAVSAVLEVDGQQVGDSDTPFTFTLGGTLVKGTATAENYPVANFLLYPAPPPGLKVSVKPTAIPYHQQVAVVVHAADPETGATVSGSVTIDGTTVGVTDATFTRTFTTRTVQEFNPDTKTWSSQLLPPDGSVSATGYDDAPIPFVFYHPRLGASAQPTQLPVGTPTQVTVTAHDAFTKAPVAGNVTIEGQPVGQTNTPFSYTLSVSIAYGSVQAAGYPNANFSIHRVPPPRLRVWTTPHPVPENQQVQLTVHTVNDQTNAPVSGAVLVDNQQVGLTNTPFSFELERPPAEFDPETKSWITYALPTGTVSAVGFPETRFTW
jgi:hypothetical protein